MKIVWSVTSSWLLGNAIANEYDIMYGFKICGLEKFAIPSTFRSKTKTVLFGNCCQRVYERWLYNTPSDF